MSTTNRNFVPRVTQVDSVELDKEIVQVLRTQVGNIANVTSGIFWDRWEPEISALLRFYIWKLSVHQFHSTIGQQLLNLKYEGKLNRYKSYTWAFLTIVPLYFKDKLDSKSKSPMNSSFQLVSQSFQWIYNISRLAALFNTLLFLKDGKYPQLTDRVLKMRLQSATKQQRSVGYTYMTRELVWHILIELLGSVLPLINYYSLRRKIYSMLSKSQKQHVGINPPILKPGNKCVICKQLPIHPHHIGCSHVYCFYCIQGNLLADSGFQCPVCGVSVENAVALPVPHNKTFR